SSTPASAGGGAPTTAVAATPVATAVQPAQPAGWAVPGAPSAPGCWQQVRPLGSGGFPPAPGSQDAPTWEPGRFPLTLTPHLAFGGQLWLGGPPHAYSSPDGLEWTQHDKTDWGERIYQ